MTDFSHVTEILTLDNIFLMELKFRQMDLFHAMKMVVLENKLWISRLNLEEQYHVRKINIM